jgi:hypothetical protein
LKELHASGCVNGISQGGVKLLGDASFSPAPRDFAHLL